MPIKTISEMLAFLESKMDAQQLKLEIHNRRLDQDDNIVRSTASVIFEIYNEFTIMGREK